MEDQTKKLEILVVEDTLKHQEAARELLKEHNVTIVSTFDEVADLISGGHDGCNPSKKRYDAVLTDMFFTQGRGDMISDESLVHQEMPFGYAVALMAVKEGTPYVAVLSDQNHHANPIAYTLDFFKKQDPEVIDLDVIGAGCSRLAVVNTRGIKAAYRTPDGRIVTEEESEERFGSELVKNYKHVLDILMDLDYKPRENLPHGLI